jgi:hypothetical protein
MAQHRYSLLGLRNDDSADSADSGEPICRMVGAKPKRKWWLWAAVTIVLEQVATFAYFIPTMISLMGSERSDLETKAALSQWLLFN